jgi:outer membrane immunogenic protein
MVVRTLGVAAAIGVFAAFPAQADRVVGDIVDQILHPTPPPVAAPPQSPSPVAAAPEVPIPPGPATPAPSSLTPFPVSTIVGPDIPDIPDIIAQPSAAPQSLPLPPSLNSRWQGFYVGANLGAGRTTGGTGSTCLNSVTHNTSGCIALNDGGLNTDGVLGGAQFGYLRPLYLGENGPQLMVGGETDLQGSGVSGSQKFPPPIPLVGFPPCTNCLFNTSQSVNWFGTLRARIGVPVDNFLIYATGGVIYGGLQTSQSINFVGSVASYSSMGKTTHAGPTVGAGIEMLLPGPWSVKLEALYYDLGKVRTVAEPMNGAFVNFSNTKTFGFRGEMIRLGINLRLGDITY